MSCKTNFILSYKCLQQKHTCMYFYITVQTSLSSIIVRQSTWKFWPNLKLNDKVFFSFDYSSIGSQWTIPGGWHVATLEQFEIFKMAAKYVKKIHNCVQLYSNLVYFASMMRFILIWKVIKWIKTIVRRSYLINISQTLYNEFADSAKWLCIYYQSLCHASCSLQTCLQLTGLGMYQFISTDQHQQVIML